MNTKITSITLLALMTACATAPAPLVQSRCEQPLEAVALQNSAKRAVVRVVTESGSGTGFVIRPTQTETLIVTNHHVVADGQSFEVELESGITAELDVVLVDIEADLALLKPRGSVNLPSLSMNETEPEPGQSVMVLGYPGVRGSNFALTVETGAVTSLQREVDGRRYIQTNANVNGGNSGGPVLDGCGSVVGVVVAKMIGTDRTNLLIPMENVFALLDRHFAPNPGTDFSVRSTVNEFFESLSYRQPMTAAKHLSREMVFRAVQSDLQKQIERLQIKIGRLKKLDPDLSADTITGSLTKPEQELLLLLTALEQRRINQDSALRMWWAGSAEHTFGFVSRFEVQSVRAERGSMLAKVQIIDRRGNSRDWLIQLTEDWGRWAIDGFQRI